MPERFVIELPELSVVDRSELRWSAESAEHEQEIGAFGVERQTAIARRARRSGGAEPKLEAAEGQILEVEYEGGYRELFRVGDPANGRVVRSGSQSRYAPTLAAPASRRRELSAHPRSVRVLSFDLAESLLAEAEEEVAERGASMALAAVRALEKRWVKPGFFRALDPASPESIDAADVRRLTAGDEPTLLLIHGTFSNPLAFDDLSGTREWSRLREKYGERILAFGHRTMSESPVTNAVQLLSELSADCHLELVTHSRGGLVGEMLLKADWNRRSPNGDDAAFLDLTAALGGAQARADSERLQQELEQLADAHVSVRPKVGRFVRVACPAAGTALAGPRLHRFLSVVTSGLGVVTGWSKNPLYRFVRALTLDIIKRGTTEGDLPGLAAMSPGRPFLSLIAASDPIESPLTVVAGDIEADRWYEKVAIWATDRFFRTDHDLVVNTPSMYAGAPRVKRPEEVFLRGRDVNHFSYFRNDRSRLRISEALLRHDPYVAPPSRARSRSHPARAPQVFMLPGVGGSELHVEEGKLWVSYFRLIFGGIDRLVDDDGPSDRLTVGRADEDHYADLMGALGERFECVPYPYDWRLPLLRLGRMFGDELRRALATHERPIQIVAHSMGGLVARAALLDAELRSAFASRGGRVLMLGTPNRGAVAALRMLVGDEALARRIGVFDLEHSLDEVLEIVRRLPGLIGLVPSALLDERRWPSSQRPSLEALGLARAGWEQLDAGLEAVTPLVRYVAGVAEHTPASATWDSDEDRWRYEWSRRGDGRVLHDDSILDARHAWFLDAEHGDLPRVPEAFEAYVELVRDGRTELLPQTPPGYRGELLVAPTAPREAPRDEQLLVWTPRTLMDDVLGSAPSGAKTATPDRAVRFSVVHGGLQHVERPVLLGHFRGDPLTSAARAVDELAEGAIQIRHARGILPSEVGWAQPILSTRQCALRAVVTGLGPAGGLDRRHLAEAYRTGLLAFATAAAERGEARFELATVALGATDLGRMSIEEAVQSLAEAVFKVNRQLRAEATHDPPQIARVLVVEHYADRAAYLAHAARRLPVSLPIAMEAGERLIVDESVTVRQGNRGPRPALRWGPRRWARFRIAYDRAEEVLRFELPTDSTRSEVLSLRLAQAEAGETLKGLWTDIARSPRSAIELAERYRMLQLPASFRDAIGRGRDVQLVLDADAALIPWELIAFLDPDGRPDARATASVRHGFIRGLEVSTDAPRATLASERVALVVGNPVDAGLPGAAREASAVRDQLAAAGWTTRSAIDADDSEIADLLARRGFYRVMHIAAHGFAEGDLSASYVSLGRHLRLDASWVQSIPDALPEMVFLNTCYAGAAGDSPELQDLTDEEVLERVGRTSQLASAFMSRGVRAFVAAAWSIQDDAAALFAERLYAAMLAGEPFGHAVDQARRVTQLRYPRDSTWAAYQCYGDPDYRLIRLDEAQRCHASRVTVFVAAEEALDEINSIISDARALPAEARSELVQRVRALADEVERRGWGGGELQRRLAVAYAELGQLKEAIAHYRHALRAADGHASYKSLDALVELRDRLAWRSGQLVEDFDAAEQRDVHREAIESAQHLLALDARLEAASGASARSRRARFARIACSGHLHLAAIGTREGVFGHLLRAAEALEALASGGSASPEPGPEWAGVALDLLSEVEDSRVVPDVTAADRTGSSNELLAWCVDRAWVALLRGEPMPEPLVDLARRVQATTGRSKGATQLLRSDFILLLAVAASPEIGAWRTPTSELAGRSLRDIVLAAYRDTLPDMAARHWSDVALERLHVFLTLAEKLRRPIEDDLLEEVERVLRHERRLPLGE